MTRSIEKEGSTSNNERDSVPGRRPEGIRALLGHRDLLACLIILAMTALVFIPIYVRGFPAGTDAGFHLRWVNQFSEAWREAGVFYPRWLGSANEGQGSPVMLYYPPVTIFTAAVLKILVGDTLRALALSCWLGLAASGLAMYVFSRSLWSGWPALFAALLYLCAPYHLFDLYQGSVVAEFWSFAWLPLVLAAVYRVAQGNSWRAVAYLGVSYALLLLTHVPISFAITLMLPVYVLLLTRQVRQLVQIAIGVGLGLALSAVFFLPVMFERDCVRIGALLMFGYENFFLFQHLGPAYETKLFLPDLSSYRYSETLKADSYLYLLQTDQVALGLVLLFLAVSIVILLRRRFGRSPLRSRMIRATLVLAALSLLMTTRLSAAIWQVVPQLPYMQFPFRFLVISTAAICLLAGAAASTLVPPSRMRTITAGILGSAVAFNLVLSGFLVARAPIETAAFDPNIPRRERPEYRPIWWNRKFRSEEQLPAFVISRGEASAAAIDDQGIKQNYVVDASSETEIKFRTLYFPGWTARVDGKLTEIGPSEEGSIKVLVEPGEHSLTLRFEDTPPRTAGKLISAAGLLILMGMLYATSNFWIRNKSRLTSDGKDKEDDR